MASILVADDDKTYRESLQKVLEHEGHSVEAVPDVDSALEALHAGLFDLIVCDYRMPSKSGIDLLQQLRREKSNVPVLMISACADASTKARAMELGAVELLGKPVKRQTLIERAARFAGGRSDPMAVENISRIATSAGCNFVTDSLPFLSSPDNLSQCGKNLSG